MKKADGISLSLSSFEKGLWYDHDECEYHPEGYGIRFHIVWGKWLMPIPCFHKLDFWKQKLGLKNSGTNYNYWHGGEWWFVLRVPFMIGPFLAIAFRNYGVYFGFKTYGATSRLNTPERYGKWMRPEEFGPIGDEARYLQLSATIRSTRWE